MKPLLVTIVNGGQLSCDQVCKGFQWEIQGERFENDCRMLKLGGRDVVLGMDWIDMYAPIELHTRPLSISFHKEGKKVNLKGLVGKQRLKVVSKKEVNQWKTKGVKGFLVMYDSKGITGGELQGELCGIAEQHPDIAELREILQEFIVLFQEPTTLPPARYCDHEVPLLPNAKPVNVGPYRYSHEKKNVIERMVQEMLDSGIITPGTSPFASLVLLVPKKDFTWRFCVDYKALNAITVKNKFHIHVVEDIFSELAGYMYYSKIDLRSGYHQVRMKVGEEYKIAFRTHQSLFEFRVMPFGLTNAPTTFQALMNNVLKLFLRKFVLVFFDDILIYSPDMESHLLHLRQVFQVMKENKLYAKMNKCSFAQPQTEYLGHVISHEGLQIDPTKIEAVKQWPKPKYVKEMRGFLGLTGYYRRFIRGYGVISRPLSNMRKKNAF